MEKSIAKNTFLSILLNKPPRFNSPPLFTFTMSSAFAALPSVETLTKDLLPSTPLPRPLVTRFIQRELTAWRKEISEGATPSTEEISTAITEKLRTFSNSRLQPVINATGVVIHTNLGRSPLGEGAASALQKIITGYTNLEFDLPSGERGPRGAYLETALATVIGAEKATLVNNCAAALVVTLRELTTPEKNEVIVSRSELVEIGGGFRIPDILETSGCKLVEIGTTNKTHLHDYENALTEKTALILKVHRSNFFIGGFTHEPEVTEIATLAKKHGIPLIEDLGSGALMNTDELAPLDHEPTPTESLHNGIDLITFSGDKLLGGPQAGIIAGREDLVLAIKKNPLFRAIRCDKIILTTMQEAIDDYLRAREAEENKLPDIPTIQALSTSVESLQKRAETILKQLPDQTTVTIVPSTARTGGGTMPQSEIPSVALQITPTGISLSKLAKQFRTSAHPIVGYSTEDKLHFDLRTVLPHQDEILMKEIERLLS